MYKRNPEDILPEDHQESEYIRPYHYMITEFGSGIIYINLLRVLSRLIDPRKGEPILDAGCGDGRLIHEIAGAGASMFGVDKSIKALRWAAGFNPGAILSLQDICSLAFADESFAKVTLIETLEHIPTEHVPEALAEIRRVLKTGGQLIVTVPTHRLIRPLKHYRHFSPGELRMLLDENFTVRSVIGYDRDLKLYRFLVRLGNNRLWHLRAGYNDMLRYIYGRYLVSPPPEKARTLIAVCLKK